MYLITGVNGQLGTELKKRLPNAVGADVDVLDITNEAAVNKYGFSAVSKDSPDYERVFKKWVDIMDKEVFINSMPLEITVEQLVETALESGDPMDLLPRYIGRAEIDFAQLTDE